MLETMERRAKYPSADPMYLSRFDLSGTTLSRLAEAQNAKIVVLTNPLN